MTDYAGNSKKSKEQKDDIPDKKVERVVESKVVARKRPLGKRFMETFFGGDFKSAAQYLAAEVLLPEARRVLVEMAWKGTERVVFGDSKARPRNSSYGPGTRYNYNAVSLGSDPRERRIAGRGNLPDQPSRPGVQRGRSSDQDLVFTSREDAERVVEALSLILEKYDLVSVADLHELVGLPTVHTDQKWGWDRLTEVSIRQIREGFLLELPPADPIQ